MRARARARLLYVSLCLPACISKHHFPPSVRPSVPHTHTYALAHTHISSLSHSTLLYERGGEGLVTSKTAMSPCTPVRKDGGTLRMHLSRPLPPSCSAHTHTHGPPSRPVSLPFPPPQPPPTTTRTKLFSRPTQSTFARSRADALSVLQGEEPSPPSPPPPQASEGGCACAHSRAQTLANALARARLARTF